MYAMFCLPFLVMHPSHGLYFYFYCIALQACLDHVPVAHAHDREVS